MTNDELKVKFNDTEIMYLTIIGEARGETISGQVAVGNNILVRSHIRNMSIKDVCLQRAQYSCWNENDPNRAVLMDIADKMLMNDEDPDYKQIWWIVDGLIHGHLDDNIHGKEYYMTTQMFNFKRPVWAQKLKDNPIIIGNHTFFNV